MKELSGQTFGVEIEMYNISREAAAKLVAKYFKTTAWDSAEELKYHSWACKDKQDRLWQFRRDTSIKPNKLTNKNTPFTGYDYVCELVTPVLSGESDLELLCKLVQILIDNGAKSDASMQCSVHVHIGAKGYSVAGLVHLLNVFSKVEPILAKSLVIDKYRILRYCKPLEQELLNRMNSVNPKKMDTFYNIWYKDFPDMKNHYNKSRYHALNMHSLKCHGTVEYRIFEFRDSMDIKQLKAFILFCSAFSQHVKNRDEINTDSMSDILDGFDSTFEEDKLLREVFCRKKTVKKKLSETKKTTIDWHNEQDEQRLAEFRKKMQATLRDLNDFQF